VSGVNGACPADSTELFDTLVMGGVRSPGVIVAKTGFDREENYDVKESDGQKGATTTWKGTKCGSGSVTFYLLKNDEVDDFSAWDNEFAPMLESTVPPLSGAKPVAKECYHPDLARNGYTAMVKRKIGALVHDGKGGATVAVELGEYYPPKPAKAGGASGTKKKSAEDPNDPLVQARKELENLLKEGNTPP
jgi:hypothetical protein